MKNPSLMPDAQRCGGLGPGSPAWKLARRQACVLPAAGQGRWLRVLEGELWLTRTADAVAASEDCWLRTGQRLRLPAGAGFVVEAWHDSRFELLLEPVPAPRPLAWLQAALRRLAPAPRRRTLGAA